MNTYKRFYCLDHWWVGRTWKPVQRRMWRTDLSLGSQENRIGFPPRYTPAFLRGVNEAFGISLAAEGLICTSVDQHHLHLSEFHRTQRLSSHSKPKVALRVCWTSPSVPTKCPLIFQFNQLISLIDLNSSNPFSPISKCFTRLLNSPFLFKSVLNTHMGRPQCPHLILGEA